MTVSLKYKIGIWGQFGSGKVADGQAVRTNVITAELKARYGVEAIGVANTNSWTKRPFAFLRESVSLIRDSSIVAILPADKGFMVFAPMLTLMNKVWKRHLIYIVIGGFLPALLEKKPQYISVVKKFDALFVQTENLKKDLEKFGIDNISILSNLKRLNTRKLEDVQICEESSLKLCVFSRIIKEKGIEDAIEAVRLANERLGDRRLTLDLFGMVPASYADRLEDLLSQNSDFVSYKGVVDYDKTVETLKDYFAMLFPTYYYGEGFPGNIVDAFNTGLPVIATDWLYNSDFIEHGKNGLIVSPKNPVDLSEAIIRLYEDRNLAYAMAQNNIIASANYQPDKVLEGLYELIDGYLNEEGVDYEQH